MKTKMVQLYDHLKPGERIDSILLEYLSPILEPMGFKYVKSKRSFKKKGDFFDLHLSWFGQKYNEKNIQVEFDIFLSAYSPKYRKWEKTFYEMSKNWPNPIYGSSIQYIDGWGQNFRDGGYYDLVTNDNIALMEEIVRNTQTAGFNFFNQFSSIDSAIEKLKEYPIKNFEKIIDFYIIQEKWKEAKEFFENNNQWHEDKEKTEGTNPDSYFSLNQKMPYRWRASKIRDWGNKNNS